MLFYDGLTDLPNRALFADRLQRALVHARLHTDYKCAVLFVRYRRIPWARKRLCSC